MDDLSNVEIDVRILIALFGLTLEKADGGKLKEAYFKPFEIHCWLGRRPDFGAFGLRFIQQTLSKMREQKKDINDGFGNYRGSVNVIASFEEHDTFFYKIPDDAAENQMSAKLIIKLDASRMTNAPVSLRDEKQVVKEIYEEFKSNPAYLPSGEEEVQRKVTDAEVSGFYFTRDHGDNLLRPTTRLHAERTFLELMSKPLPAATREFFGETKKSLKRNN